MLGLAVARSSRRYIPAIAKWTTTCRSVKTGTNGSATTHDESSSSDNVNKVPSDPMRLAESTDKAKLPESSPQESMKVSPDIAQILSDLMRKLPEASSPESAKMSPDVAKILLDLKRLAESADKAKLPEASPPESTTETTGIGSSTTHDKSLSPDNVNKIPSDPMRLAESTDEAKLTETSSPQKQTETKGIESSTTHDESLSSDNRSSDDTKILSDLMRLTESTDEAKLPEASPPESTETIATYPFEEPDAEFRSLGLKYDPSTLPLERELTARDNVSEEEYAMTLVHGRSVFSPHLHPRTHGIPVANIHFRSHHIHLLKLFTHFALHAATSLGIPASNVIPLPTQRSLWTVIRSPFVHKKSQENFERKVHKRAIKAWDADPEVVQRWVLYLRKNAMPGVGMKVTIWERVPLGIGAMDLDDFDTMDTMENLMVEAPSSIEALGQEIVAEEMSRQSS